MSDFPDWLSPMLVKELRQGLRTHFFSVSLILFHVFMVITLLIGVASSGMGTSDGFFWFFVSLLLLVVQPLRLAGALSAEFERDTMGLIQLTRLDTWKIAFGKWLALNTQTLLLLTSILPYLAMRYFIGNLEFFHEMATLYLIGLGSALCSSIVLGTSIFQSSLQRIFMLVGLGLFVIPVIFGMIENRFSSFGSMDDLALMGVATLLSAYGCFFFIAFGASRIAPPSENHATRKRITALLVSMIFMGIGLLNSPSDLSAFCGFLVVIILGLACIDAITEPTPIYSRVLEPFQNNVLTRFLAWFLAPGWLSGLGFFCFCYLFFTLILWDESLIHTLSGASAGISPRAYLLPIANIILLPIPIIHLLFPKRASYSFTFGLYLFIQGCQWALTLILGILASSLSFAGFSSDLFVYFPIPPAVLVAFNDDPAPGAYAFLLVVSAFTFILCLAIPVIRQRDVLADFIHNLKPSSRRATA